MNIVDFTEKPELHQPVLLLSFIGWGDASQSASAAIRYLSDRWAAPQVGEIDREDFYDFTATRPWVHINERDEREIRWPKLRLFAHQANGNGPDVLLLRGRQPSLRWRTFCDGVVDLAKSQNVSTVVVLGAFPARVSHTGPLPLNGWAWPYDLNRRLMSLGMTETRHEGSTGLQTVLASACSEAKIPVANLRAWVPFYLDNVVNPTGALALLDCLERAFGLEFPLEELAQSSRNFIQFVNERLVQMGTSPSQILSNPNAADQNNPIISAEDTPATNAPTGGAEPAGPETELPSVEDALRMVQEFLNRPTDS